MRKVRTSIVLIGHFIFEELNGPRRMETIWDGLAKRGMSQRQLEKLFGLNIHRLYDEVIG